MKYILLLMNSLLLLPFLLHAQYMEQGKIEYERKINVHANLESFNDDDNDKEWIENMKAQTAKFYLSYFDLAFNTEHCIYKPGRKIEDQKVPNFGFGPAKENKVLTDLNKKQVQADKEIYEQTFIVRDTMRRLQWKLTGEIRTIANYTCRKAVGRICDSVYVVAFYTDDIMVSGGPEMFSGLPGMILELAIPRLHTTWTATKVELEAPKETDFALSEKGKQVSQQQLYETLKSSFKDWGKSANRNIWWSML